MDFRHLRAFVAVAEEASITKAAKRLHISQPPLSRLVRQLETELEVTLFVRHRQGVTLTEVGRRLLEKARILSVAEADFFEAAGQTLREDPKAVRIGIIFGLWEAVNKIRVAYTTRFPGAALEAKDFHSTAAASEELSNRALDVAFVRGPVDAIYESALLFRERIVAVLSEDSPLASRKTVRIRELAHEPLLLWDRQVLPGAYDKMLALYAKADIVPKMIPTPGAGPHTQAGLMLVASGKGIYIGIDIPPTRPQVADGVAVVPVSDPDAAIDVCVAWRKGEASPRVLQFLECVRRVFPPERHVPAPVRTPSRRAS